MVEPLFAPVSQFWPAMPAPAFGFVQAPMGPAHRPFGTPVDRYVLSGAGTCQCFQRCAGVEPDAR